MYTRQIGGPRRVRTPQGAAHLNVHLLGPHPILLHFLERMTFFRIVRSCLPRSRPSGLDHAQSLAVLIQNILLSPGPLYRVAEWTVPIEAGVLGMNEAEKALINDDRIARSLDALVTPHARSLFFRLALHVIKHFELDTRRVHHDTTTVTFHGQYKSSAAQPRITYGMNKDHRPDLKQLVFGVNVVADGAVPISHEVYSGNRSDDTVHQGNVERLRKILGRTDFIYVADSKLCTRKNLSYVSEYGGKFVTVLPRTRAEDKRFREALRKGEAVRWRKLWVKENQRCKSDPPDIYWTTADGLQTTTDSYRIVWLKSSQKAAVDAQAREKALRKVETDLVSLSARLNRGKLKQRSAIRKAFKAVLNTHQCQPLFQVRILSEVSIQLRRWRRGRPKQGDPVHEVRSTAYRLFVQRNEEAIRGEARTDGVFPLVTNLPPTTTSKKEVLLIYKYQPYVEKRHALLKSELEVAPIFIKKPRRVAGLIHANFLAMTVDALIERTVRQNMRREGIEALPILPEGRMTKTPTTARIFEMFSDVSWYEFQREGEAVTFPVQLTPLQKQLLQLLDMDPSTYA